jgi:hypothetical protein
MMPQDLMTTCCLLVSFYERFTISTLIEFWKFLDKETLKTIPLLKYFLL